MKNLIFSLLLMTSFIIGCQPKDIEPIKGSFSVKRLTFYSSKTKENVSETMNYQFEDSTYWAEFMFDSVDLLCSERFLFGNSKFSIGGSQTIWFKNSNGLNKFKLIELTNKDQYNELAAKKSISNYNYLDYKAKFCTQHDIDIDVEIGLIFGTESQELCMIFIQVATQKKNYTQLRFSVKPKLNFQHITAKAIEEWWNLYKFYESGGWNDSIITHEDLGDAKMLLEDHPGAKCEFDLAIEENPEDAKFYLKRGEAKFYYPFYSNAIEDFNKALEIDKNLDDAYVYLGRICTENKDFSCAYNNFNKALQVAKYPHDAYYYRARLKLQKKDYAGGLEDLSRAIDSYSRNAEAFYFRGITQGVLKNYTELVLDCSKAIDIKPDYEDAFIARGTAKGYLGDHRGAIADFDKAIQINPRNVEAYYERAKSKGSIRDYQGSEDDCSQAIKINPFFAEAYLFRGLAKNFSGQKDNGCGDFSKAGELGLESAYKAIKEYCK